MIVLTAPTGAIGRQVLDNVLNSDESIRVIVRDPSRLPAAARDRVEVVQGSHGDADVVAKAFAGADAVFWLVPPNPRAENPEAAYSGFSRPACEAFTEQGVRRVVGVSALGRGVTTDAGLVTATLDLDDLIASTGVHYRALTMPSFMDNLLRQTEALKTDGVFSLPFAPDHAAPMCATRDIAAVAADLLLDPTWTGVDSVPVLGPEDLSPTDLARIMSDVLGKPIRYRRGSIEDFEARLLAAGATEAMARGTVAMYRAKAEGLDNAEPRTPRSSTPTTFRRWCEDVLKPAVLA
ncbi:NAD(P)H-binding protein [Umezawaea sp. NPDC059074]|uniref:NmrA family NAD(P)-binding protein n=1 Tax=Umezawaea sp. NPDC059074 TaxID=3346716 RepID=UPI0036D035E0